MSNTPTKRNYKDTYVLEGEVRWAKVIKPTEEGKYEVDMLIKDKKTETLLKSLGIRIQTDKEDSSVKYVKFSRYANNPDGTPKPFKIIDGKLNAFDKLVGNGSICRIEFFDREWEYKGKSGVTAYMVGFQVIEHVPFNPSNSKLTAVTGMDEDAMDMEANRFSK